VAKRNYYRNEAEKLILTIRSLLNASDNLSSFWLSCALLRLAYYCPPYNPKFHQNLDEMRGHIDVERKRLDPDDIIKKGVSMTSEEMTSFSMMLDWQRERYKEKKTQRLVSKVTKLLKQGKLKPLS